jgi:hypothetical protein
MNFQRERITKCRRHGKDFRMEVNAFSKGKLVSVIRGIYFATKVRPPVFFSSSRYSVYFHSIRTANLYI